MDVHEQTVQNLYGATVNDLIVKWVQVDYDVNVLRKGQRKK